MENKNNKLGSIGYFLGGVSSMLANKPIASYLLVFFTNCLLLDPAKAGLIFAIGRFADGIVGIICSNFLDKTKTKWGTYRPYLLLSIPLGISFVMCFSVPGFAVTQGQKFAWAIFAYILSQTLLKTVTGLAYQTMPTLITRDGATRARYAGMLTVGNKVADLMVSAFTMTIILKYGGTNDPRAWLYMAALYGVLIPVGFLACFFTNKETLEVAPKGEPLPPLKERIKTLKGNRPFFALMLNTAISMMVAVPAGMFFSYFVMYNLGRTDLVATLTTIGGVSAIIGGLLLGPMSKKMERRYMFVIAAVMILVGGVCILIMPNMVSAVVFIVLVMFANSLNTGTIMALVPDAANYGEWKNGASAPALLYSIVGFFLTVVSGLASSLVGSVLSHAGYDGAAAVQAESVTSAIHSWMSLSCIIMAVVAIAVSFMLKDTDRARAAEVNRALEERKKG